MIAEFTFHDALGLYNYWIVIFLMMTGFYLVIARGNLIKTIIGLNIFQTSVVLFYVTMGKVAGGKGAPIMPIGAGHGDGGHGHGDDSHGDHGHAEEALDHGHGLLEQLPTGDHILPVSFEEHVAADGAAPVEAVSYTHLTLPTNREV